MGGFDSHSAYIGGLKMKALSVRGDYVMDMITGKKKIEYRTW